MCFSILKFGDAVAEQAADAIGFFEDGDGMTGAAELLGGGESSRARTHNRDSFSRASSGGSGLDPAFVGSRARRCFSRSA